MSRRIPVSARRRYGCWAVLAFVVVAAAAVSLLAVRFLRDGEEPTVAPSKPRPAAAALPQPLDASSAKRLATAPRLERQSPEESTRKLVEEYEERIASAPDAKETPDVLMALANVYRQKLLDYEKAAECYEQVIERFPESPRISNAYVQLSTCYQRMDAGERANRLHLRMLERFPEGSQENLYARSQLGWE